MKKLTKIAIAAVLIVMCMCATVGILGKSDETDIASTEPTAVTLLHGILPTVLPTRTLEPTITYTPKPTATITHTPTITTTPTSSKTPTVTLEPRNVTRTAQAIQRQAKQAFEESIRSIRRDCSKAIDWIELSEVEYAKDHEGDCIYIKGRISDLNFEEELIEIWIGYYSARIPVGIGDLNNRPGRLTEDMWINAYGFVCTKCWTSTNRLDGSVTSIAGIQAILIEGPHVLIWVQE